VLKWIFERVDADDEDASEPKGAVHSPVGLIPARGSLDVRGLDITPSALDAALKVDVKEWQRETEGIREYYRTFADHLPHDLIEELNALETRLTAAGNIET
jgi:phosphoenolpyruvate carboxykinase (GTP)